MIKNHAKKGKLISLIDSDLYTASKFVTTHQLQLADQFILSEELDAPDAPGVPAYIAAFLNFMGKCTQHAFAKNAIVTGIGFADTNVEHKVYFLQWAEHCLNTIVDRRGTRVFNSKAFVEGGDKRVDKGGSTEPPQGRLAHLAYMWANFAFNDTLPVQETFTLTKAPWVYYSEVMEAAPWNDSLKKHLGYAEVAGPSLRNDMVKNKSEDAEDFVCARHELFDNLFNFDIEAKMSFQVLVWLGKDGIADARLIYGGLVNEARVRSRTRTTYWRNDSAKLQVEVRNKFGRHVPAK